MAHEQVPGLWDQLNTTTLGGTTAATAGEIATQTDPIHIEAGNLAAIQSANIINEGAMRDGSPIPATGIAFNIRLGDTTRTNWFTPGAGEVWKLIGASAGADQPPSSAYTFTLYLDTNDADGTQRIIWLGNTKDIDTQYDSIFGLTTMPGSFYVGENSTVQISVNNMRGTTYIDCDMYAMRVR